MYRIESVHIQGKSDVSHRVCLESAKALANYFRSHGYTSTIYDLSKASMFSKVDERTETQ